MFKYHGHITGGENSLRLKVLITSFFTNRYRLVRPPDGKWGGPQPDGSITGLIGQVARHEAHASLCELTITGSFCYVSKSNLIFSSCVT